MSQTTTVTLIPQISYAGASPLTIVGERKEAAAYYLANRDLQTITWNLQNTFAGTIKIQASLATNPGIFDWFDVYSLPINTQSSGPPQTGYYNLRGNFVWLRAYVSNWTAGNIQLVSASY